MWLTALTHHHTPAAAKVQHVAKRVLRSLQEQAVVAAGAGGAGGEAAVADVKPAGGGAAPADSMSMQCRSETFSH